MRPWAAPCRQEINGRPARVNFQAQRGGGGGGNYGGGGREAARGGVGGGPGRGPPGPGGRGGGRGGMGGRGGPGRGGPMGFEPDFPQGGPMGEFGMMPGMMGEPPLPANLLLGAALYFCRESGTGGTPCPLGPCTSCARSGASTFLAPAVLCIPASPATPQHSPPKANLCLPTRPAGPMGIPGMMGEQGQGRVIHGHHSARHSFFALAWHMHPAAR